MITFGCVLGSAALFLIAAGHQYLTGSPAGAALYACFSITNVVSLYLLP